MDIKNDLKKQAKILPYDRKRDYFLSFKETQIHSLLKTLIERMEANSTVEITHGKDEYGRDLVIKRKDVFAEQYVGVVVKKGDANGKITGRSNDVLDEIISQVKQAFEIPVYLREIEVGSVRISHVWIVFVGALTENASQRVEYQLKTLPINIFPIAWLIKNFEEYYPEFFFDAEVTTFMQEQYTSLDLKGNFTKNNISLSENFVEPWVCEVEAFNQLDEEVLQALRNKRLPFKRLEEMIEPGKKIMLVGDPGTGKSTALAKIAQDLIRSNIKILTQAEISPQTKLKVPILIKATEFTSFKDCKSLLITYFKNETLLDRLEISLLLVDGLDELKTKTRDEVIKKAEQFCQEMGCSIIVSSRKVEAAKHAITSFHQYELLPFDHDQAIMLIEKMAKDEKIIHIIKDALQNQELKLVFTPLTLQLLIDIVREEREIPASIAEVFDQYTNLAFGKLDIANGIDSVFAYLVKKDFLANLAWEEFGKKEQLRISKEDFESFISRYMGNYSRDKEKLEQFISEIERAGILRIGEMVFFRHRSFLDYFMAYHISQQLEEIPNIDDFIVKMYFSDFLSEAAFFFVGIRRKITIGMVNGILEYPDKNFETNVSKLLIGRLLQAAWNSLTETKKKAIIGGINYSTPVSEQIRDFIQKMKNRPPLVIADYFAMAMCEYAYHSRTISEETMDVAKELLQGNDAESVTKSLLLVMANRSLFPTQQLSEYGRTLLEASARVEKLGRLTSRDRFITLLMLQYIEENDTKFLNSIRRKMQRVQLNNADEFRRFLPLPKKGFRKKPK